MGKELSLSTGICQFLGVLEPCCNHNSSVFVINQLMCLTVGLSHRSLLIIISSLCLFRFLIRLCVKITLNVFSSKRTLNDERTDELNASLNGAGTSCVVLKTDLNSKLKVNTSFYKHSHQVLFMH